jgi:hypothetical protein
MFVYSINGPYPKKSSTVANVPPDGVCVVVVVGRGVVYM